MTLSIAIERHRQAVMVDEAQFDDDGVAIDEQAAELTLKAEQAAYMDLATFVCESHGDVQAKLDYFINGTVGERTALLTCLGLDDYGGGDVAASFVRSLLLSGGSR